MIVITGQQGQLGNSLIVYSTFLAFTNEHKTMLINPSFHQYKYYFTYTDRNIILNKFTFTFFYYFTRLLIKLRYKHIKSLDWEQSIDLDKPEDLGDYKKILFVQGWQFRGHKTLMKNKELIKNIFTPKPKYIEQLNVFFEKTFKHNCELIIGVHIRRGDYKTFENGKYYYSMPNYVQIIEKLVFLFKNLSVRFLICSNEQFKPSDFGEVKDKIVFGPNHELLDMYSLARCSYIVGPPSTYSMWASFYGNVPLYMIHDINKDISTEDFKIQTHF